jgi:hypothetical protein
VGRRVGARSVSTRRERRDERDAEGELAALRDNPRNGNFELIFPTDAETMKLLDVMATTNKFDLRPFVTAIKSSPSSAAATPADATAVSEIHAVV